MAIDKAKFTELCAKLGFDDLTDEEIERVIARADAPPMMGPQGGAAEVDIDTAIALVGCAPFAAAPSVPDDGFVIGGTCNAGYEGVKDAFAANYAKGLERNSQLCIYKDGRPVVDLWGSNLAYSTAPESGYDGDTLQIVYSSTKNMSASVFALAADRGLFKYDDKVAHYWPEFAQNGKADMTIADVLRHDAGLQQFDENFSLEDTADQVNPAGNMSRIIAAQRPWAWRGGPDEGLTPRIYHAISRGFILNQILIRADPAGRTIGQWMQEELCGPLSADFYCGTAGSDAWLTEKARAEMETPDVNFIWANTTVPDAVRRECPDKHPLTPEAAAMAKVMADPMWKLHPNVDVQAKAPASMGGGFDPSRPEIEAPSASGRASARGMARVMAMLAGGGELDGVRVLSEAGRDACIANPVSTNDRNHEKELNKMSVVTGTAFVQGGFDSSPNVGPGFGWGGAGGSSIWFDPKENVGFGYTVTGFAAGFSGDQNRLGPIVEALMKKSPAFAASRAARAAAKL